MLIKQGRVQPYKTHVTNQNARQLGQIIKTIFLNYTPIGIRCSLGLASKWVATGGMPTLVVQNLGMLKKFAFPTH